MKKHSVCAAVVLVAVISLSGCGDGAAPVQPTQSIAEPGQVFSLSGRVTDIFYHPLGGSRVEVITGPRAGTAATTDDAGRFSMPGTFTGTITVLASRDGYVSETREVPLHPRSYPPPPSGGTASWEIAVPLEPVGPVTNIAGAYGLTLTADSAKPHDVQSQSSRRCANSSLRTIELRPRAYSSISRSSRPNARTTRMPENVSPTRPSTCSASLRTAR